MGTVFINFFALQRKREFFYNATVLKMSNSKTAIPLCLPNNCHWDPQTGEYSKTADVERDKLHAVAKALQKLREIKGPVCVVTIAGPCRKGKSYILSKAFDQGEVFPLGHLLDPETMGIWMWVVPEKYTDKNGQEFTVVLLDSEGIDAVFAKKTDDHRVFTLTVLLASVMIYNSVGVPTRTDLDSLEYPETQILIWTFANLPSPPP